MVSGIYPKDLIEKVILLIFFFEKSDDLDNAIIVWNTIKFKLKENQNEL